MKLKVKQKTIIQWIKKKPKFNKNSKECLLLTAVKFSDKWEYRLYEMKKINYEENWYWGILTEDGDEWGDYADLKAKLYCILPLLRK